jgi:hypothetical protein
LSWFWDWPTRFIAEMNAFSALDVIGFIRVRFD